MTVKESPKKTIRKTRMSVPSFRMKTIPHKKPRHFCLGETRFLFGKTPVFTGMIVKLPPKLVDEGQSGSVQYMFDPVLLVDACSRKKYSPAAVAEMCSKTKTRIGINWETKYKNPVKSDMLIRFGFSTKQPGVSESGAGVSPVMAYELVWALPFKTVVGKQFLAFCEKTSGMTEFNK